MKHPLSLTTSVGALLSAVSLAQETWTDPLANSGPPGRYQSALAYDSVRQVTVMFGGAGTGTPSNLGDTWEWDGVDWRERFPIVSPGDRYDQSMCYDSVRQRTVLFGGYSTVTGSALTDTWEFDGSIWLQRFSATRPNYAYGTRMAFDTARARTVLFGGGNSPGALSGETWEWDGTNWLKRTPATAPSPRALVGLAYDSARGHVVLFGGYSASSGERNDTWEWDGTTWSQRFPATVPPTRYNMYFAYDSVRQRTVMMGGWGSGQTDNSTWEWDGTDWVARTTSRIPTGRIGNAAAFDSARGQCVLFGSNVVLGSNQTWEFDGTNWSLRPPTHRPVPRYDHALAPESTRGTVLLFGGSDGQPLADTWRFENGAWQDLGVAPPAARYGHAMVEDTARGTLVMFGGAAAGILGIPIPMGDTVEWDGAAWNTRAPKSAPPARYLHAMAYDAARHRVVLFGGSNGLALLAETWEYDGATWVQRTPATSPPAMAHHAMAYDARRARTVLYGRTPTANVSETWEWDGTDWTRFSPLVSPVPRGRPAFAYDPIRGRTVLFGGGWSGIGTQQDTWEWDGTLWYERFPPSPPPPRERTAMAFLTSQGRMLLFGGSDSVAGLYQDTWEYAVPCDRVGEGQVGGALPLTCTTPPELGGNFCFGFPSPAGTAALFFGAAPTVLQPIPLLPPLACTTINIHVAPIATLAVYGNPAAACFALPSTPSLAGLGFAMQGFAVDPTGCLRATDPFVVTLQAP